MQAVIHKLLSLPQPTYLQVCIYWRGAQTPSKVYKFNPKTQDCSEAQRSAAWRLGLVHSGFLASSPCDKSAYSLLFSTVLSYFDCSFY